MTWPTRAACEAVLIRNDRGSYTVPSPRLYPHQWAWDSAFAAIGWAHLDPSRAWRELRTLLDGAWPDGRVPHVYYHDLSGDYAPRPEFWETERTSTLSQPPVWATAARRVAEVTADPSEAHALLPAIDRSHRWFHAARDPLGWGVVSVAHPWESGMDNLPAWDAPLAAIDPSGEEMFERRDTKNVDHADQRPTDAHYRRYAAIVKGIARDGFGHGPFAVYDPFMSAVLARAEDDLVWLAEELGESALAERARERAARLRAGLDARLWDETRGCYRYWDARADRAIDAEVVGSYLPLLCVESNEKRAALVRGLRTRFSTPWGVATTSPLDAGFEPRRYWRGPVWVSVNWLLADVLPRGHAVQTLDLVGQGGMFEYFDPTSGEGLGTEQFTWTAALALDLMVRLGADGLRPELASGGSVA